jgi:uncharacterized coiled-coil DUF342 family protein
LRDRVTLMDSQQVETPVEHLYSELRELRARTVEKKVKISVLRERIDEAMTERDALNAEVKRISARVRKLKSDRDSLNAKVKELKNKRDELRNEAAKKRETLTQLLEQARGISEQLHGSVSDILTQIKRLEWFIQTNPLAPQAERNLVAKIGALEANLAKHKGLKNVRDKLLQLKIDVGALRIRAQSTHEELMKIAEESEKVHESMKESLKLLAEARKKADQKHNECIAHIEERHEAISALKSNLARMDEIRARIREAVPSKVEKAERVKSKYKEAANEKIRTGGKLSFEEFQALMGDSPSDGDDE